MNTNSKCYELECGGAMQRLLLTVSLLSALTGCSVFMAAYQPEKKNLDVLAPGVPRQVVLAEMGLPAAHEDRDGVRSEVYKFKQGYSQTARISRAVFHGTADILTIGLWEAVGTPAEYYFSGTDTFLRVTYDRSECVETIEYYKGGEPRR